MPKITFREAVDVLRRHNAWRRGDDAEMLDPGTISRAIEAIVAHSDGLAAAAAAQAKQLGAVGRRERARAGGLAKSAAKCLKD
jgi:hypothetical protein